MNTTKPKIDTTAIGMPMARPKRVLDSRLGLINSVIAVSSVRLVAVVLEMTELRGDTDDVLAEFVECVARAEVRANDVSVIARARALVETAGELVDPDPAVIVVKTVIVGSEEEVAAAAVAAAATCVTTTTVVGTVASLRTAKKDPWGSLILGSMGFKYEKTPKFCVFLVFFFCLLFQPLFLALANGILWLSW